MTLVVFFSRGVSLETWHRAGTLDRELALFRGLLAPGDRAAFVTYGAIDDGRHVRGWSEVDVLPNTWGLPGNLYSLAAPLLHWRALRAASLFRTNQLNGAWTAVIARALHRRPLILRCGFLWADNVARTTASRWRRRVTAALERFCLRRADRVIVASPVHRDEVISRYGIEAARITVVPNYVDTAAFRPSPQIEREAGHVLFVGRLEPEKNVQALIDAVALVQGTRLTVVGEGAERAPLEAHARRSGAPVTFLGRVAHGELPRLMAGANLLALPSFFEGVPKVIVEAMACGLPVLGTRVPGIRDLVSDGQTGLLCGTTATELADGIRAVLADPAATDRRADAALAFAQHGCSLSTAVVRERAVINELLRAG